MLMLRAGPLSRAAFVLLALPLASRAYAQVQLFEHDGFQGRSYTITREAMDLATVGFNDVASSVLIREGRWQLCSDAGLRGQCVTLGPGRYSSLRAMGLNDHLSSVRRVDAGGRNDRADVVLYEHDNYGGRSLPLDRDAVNFAGLEFNDAASSVVVRRGHWQLCSDARFRGTCVTLGPGRYPSLRAMGLNDQLSSVRRADTGLGGEGGDLVLYEHENYAGRSFAANRDAVNFANVGFNDTASSVVIRSGRWQLCSDADFRGQCVTLRPGRYPSLRAMGLNDRLSSARRVGP